MGKEGRPYDFNHPRSHPRAREIVDFYEKRLQDIKNGDRRKIPTVRELASNFDTTTTTVQKIVWGTHLGQELKETRKAKKEVTFTPSQETAWFLGMLTGTGGSLNKKGNDYNDSLAIRFTHKNPYVLDAFEETGLRILRKDNPSIQASNIKDRTSVVFHSRAHGLALGKFRDSEKTNTIKEKHTWVLDTEYIENFASGLFESCGHILKDGSRTKIVFNTRYVDVARFYQEVFLKLGVKNPVITRDKTKPEGINGIYISKIQDIRSFAQKIVSLDDKKNELLREIENSQKITKVYTYLNSKNELVDEWRRMTEQLGHTPNSTDIDKLYKLGKTPYNKEMYSRHFGRVDGKRGKISVAKDRLAQIIDQEEINTQIFPKT